VTAKPESVRRSKPVDPDVVDQIHDRLKGVAVTHRKDPDAGTLRDQFSTIRQHRNTVSRVIAVLLPKLGRLRSDMARIDQVIDAESAEAVNTGMVSGAKNVDQRKAKLRDLLSEWHYARAGIRADLHLVEEAVSHAKWVREELRYAFEETSRALASLELEWKIERSAP